jgi:exonuclease SbcD
MRILHTSDWHLGHTLRDWDRADEHAAFLAWLLDTLEAEQVDALLIAGDIFDTANPSAAAQEAWYEFLVAARRRCSGLDIVVIGGNHDSAARLDAPNPLLRAVLVPRRVPMMRIPATGSALLVDVVRAIRELPALEATALAYQPFLEISVRVEKPEPSLQQQIQDALKDRGVRLVRLSRVLSGNASPLADVARGRTLDELSPEQVFVERHRREHSAPPSAELVTAFGELLAHVHSVST